MVEGKRRDLTEECGDDGAVSKKRTMRKAGKLHTAEHGREDGGSEVMEREREVDHLRSGRVLLEGKGTDRAKAMKGKRKMRGRFVAAGTFEQPAEVATNVLTDGALEGVALEKQLAERVTGGDEAELIAGAPLRSRRGHVYESGGTCAYKTHIHDLPDDCIVHIMRHLGNTFHSILPIEREPYEDIILQHPLQCALICKRWHRLANAASCSLALENHPTVAEIVGNRFRHLTSLRLAHYWTRPSDQLVAMALSTPELEHLDLQSHLHLDSCVNTIAEALGQWTRLRHLNLNQHLCSRSGKEVETILDAVCTLQSLQHLGFCIKADLPAVYQQVDMMTSLLTLHLECPAVPSALSGHFCDILRKLVLHNFQGTHLPGSLVLFARLEALSVVAARVITELPECLGLLSHLTKLEVKDCRNLVSFPSTIGQLRSLEVLEVEGCVSIRKWPESICSLEALQTLIITGSKYLPPDLDQLNGLEHIKVEGYRSVVRLWNLPRLQKLELINCSYVDEVAGSRGHLSSLEDLLLQHSRAPPALARAVGMLTALKELELIRFGSNVKVLPDSLRHLTSLKVCKISWLPSLCQLPRGIGAWSLLMELEISHCVSLATLPEELGQLTALEKLHIECCDALTMLPEVLGELAALKELHLESCEALESLPRSLGALTSLQILRVMWCGSLKTLPESAELLTGLRRLELFRVALESVPESLRQRRGLQVDIS